MSKRLKAGLLSLFLCVAFATLILQLLSPPNVIPATADAKLFSAERAMKHLKIIAQKPHSIGTPEGQKVIDYLVKELEDLGLVVSIQDTLISKVSKRNNSVTISRVKNIIGRLKGTDNSKAILLMSHHDSQPNTPAAADDGSGVVAILESIRAIKASGTLKNDLIVLITDGEEIGLMGAKAFVEYHPALKEVGIVLNVEARGNRGVSMSFEISSENSWIIREYAKSAPYPFANSMAYEVYKIMPNDTDFSEFRNTPIAGVNSANVEGFVNYHSMTDTPENISKNTVQHHGSNMLGMVQHFGNLTIGKTRADDAIFFNPISSWLVIYPASFDIGFMILVAILFVLTVVIGIKKEQVILQHLLIGTGYFLVVLTLSGIGSYLLQQGILSAYPAYTSFYANNSYNVSCYFFSFLGLCAFFYALIFSFQSQFNGLSLSLGGVLMLVLAMFGLTISLPTATYLLYVPLLFFLIIQLLLLFKNINGENKPLYYAIGQFIALIPAIALWTQTIYMLFVTFGLSIAVIAPVLLFSFLIILAIPIIRMISLEKKWLLNSLSLVLFFGGLIAGHFSSQFTKDKPLQTYLMYGVDADNNKAVWASNKRYQNDWIKQHITTNEAKSFDEIYPSWNWKIWKTEAPKSSVSPVLASLSKDTILTDNQRFIDLNIQLPVFKNSIEFFLEGGQKISNIMINDFVIKVTPNKRDGGIYLNFHAPPMDGFHLKITTTNKVQKLRLVDRTIGLPKGLLKTPLPENMIHGTGARSNVILIKKSYAF